MFYDCAFLPEKTMMIYVYNDNGRNYLIPYGKCAVVEQLLFSS